jgi:hypothetical protein
LLTAFRFLKILRSILHFQRNSERPPPQGTYCFISYSGSDPLPSPGARKNYHQSGGVSIKRHYNRNIKHNAGRFQNPAGRGGVRWNRLILQARREIWRSVIE